MKLISLNHQVMKQIKEVAVLSILTVFVLLACKKDPPLTPPAEALKEKMVKAKVIEYGSDLPIEGATLSICPTALKIDDGYNYYYECAGNYIDFTSNANGECFFKTDGVFLFGYVTKDWYYTRLSDCLLENDGGTKDSFTVRLVPYTYVTVHIKDTSTIVKRAPLLLLSRGLLYPRFGDGGECYTVPSYPVVELRPQIDTTFQYLVYGNADNEFTISERIIYSESRPVGVIHQEMKYIPKTGNLTVEIIY